MKYYIKEFEQRAIKILHSDPDKQKAVQITATLAAGNGHDQIEWRTVTNREEAEGLRKVFDGKLPIEIVITY